MVEYLSEILSKMADSAERTPESVERLHRCILLVVDFCAGNGVEVPGFVAEIATRLENETGESGDDVPPL